MAAARHREPRTTFWWIASGTTVAIAIVSLSLFFTDSSRGLPGPVSSVTLPSPVVELGAPLVDPSRPVRLIIPALSMSVPLTQVGLNANGTVQVPSTVSTPGWYRDGASPGQLGSAVILGHVDSHRGIGVFFYLRTLRAGDLIEVDLANHDAAHFEVTSIRTFTKAAFPDREVYGSHGFSGLNLVTCGGVFDAATGHYESNIVVFASLLRITRR